MKFKTSYYANIPNIRKDYILVSISGGITNDIKKLIDIHEKRLAPSWSIFEQYKTSLPDTLREHKYIERFQNEILDNLDINELLNSFGDKDKTYVLLCYEKPSDFCHRHIVAREIEKKYNIEVPEIGMSDDYERRNFKIQQKDLTDDW